MTLLERYNEFFNLECAALPSGSPVSMEELQAIALESMVDAFKRKYNLDPIPAEEIVGLALELRMQGLQSIESAGNEITLPRNRHSRRGMGRDFLD